VTDSGAIRLSWSRLRLHDECPAKGALMRSSKSPVANIRDFFHGNVVDLAMRRWLQMADPPAGWMLAHVDELFHESIETARETGDGVVKWRSATDRAEVMEFCRELVTRLEPILQRYALPFTWYPARRFSVPVTVNGREVVLIGEMDLMVEDRDGLIAVWDLKATRDNSYYRKVLGQLAFYSLAVAAMTGKFPVMTGLIQPMCDQQVLPVEITEQAKREMAARIERTVADIWASRLAPKADDKGCDWCAVKAACPKFKLARPVRAAA
jgi:hypothetical protein